MPEQPNLRSVAPLFDIQYVAPSQSRLDEYLAYRLEGVRDLRSCHYSRWRSQFDESVSTFRVDRPQHGACIGRVLTASSLYNLASVGIGEFMETAKPFPVFVRGIDLLKAELSMDSPSIALEGGICLFQPDELLLTLDDGGASTIDLFYKASRSPDVVEAIRTQGVRDVICRRHVPSLQDYLHLYRLISFAVALRAPVVVGVPDTEYLAEVDRVIGRDAAEECGLLDLIVASSRQVTQLAVSIAQRLGATIIVNASHSIGTVREAMVAACSSVMSALSMSQDSPTMGRRDVVGYLAMPLVPRHLFACKLTLGILPAGEVRTIRALARLFPTAANAFVFSGLAIPSDCRERPS